jgi:hypothetical protein
VIYNVSADDTVLADGFPRSDNDDEAAETDLERGSGDYADGNEC